MDIRRHFRFSIRLLLPLLLVGCAAKKQAGPPVPPEAAPEAAATPEPNPQASATPAQQAQLPAQGTPPPEPEPTPSAATNDKKTNGKQHGNGKKTASQGGTTRETAKNTPPKIVVRPDAEPTPSGGQISPGGNDVGRGEPSTDQLLQSTENNLNNLKAPLSTEEQDTVTHIRDWINQSRQATKDNDGIRAHTLAVKAHLACDDLMKRH